ncbi:cartilage intermediate layer protein 1 isoform X2 [Neoarius graeffei]|nr:cartilage intermediate layer protein 1 isoform X2 [Neoarius graeffei]
MKLSVFSVILITVGTLSQNQAASPPKSYVCCTQWFDRDDSNGFGDYETLKELRTEYPGKICAKPLAIEVQTLSGLSALSTGQSFQYYDTANGFACVNRYQENKKCLDYKVRFQCQCPWSRAAAAVKN